MAGYEVEYQYQIKRTLKVIQESEKMIRGYCRISRRTQNIERQIRNITKEYPTAKLYTEAYTGTKIKGRKEFEKLLSDVQAGDTVVFDSVSRMARNADEGTKLYFELYDKGVELVFLKEHYIDTSVYANNLKDRIELTGTDEDEIFKGINNYFRKLAKKQIRIAFEQAQKEVDDLHQRTKEGIETARQAGKQIGQKEGNVLHVKKKAPAMEQIKKLSRDFLGTNTDAEVMKIIGISRNTYYKYKKELAEELNK